MTPSNIAKVALAVLAIAVLGGAITWALTGFGGSEGSIGAATTFLSIGALIASVVALIALATASIAVGVGGGVRRNAKRRK